MPLKQSTKNPSTMIWVPESKNKDGVRKYMAGQEEHAKRQRLGHHLVHINRLAEQQARVRGLI